MGSSFMPLRGFAIATALLTRVPVGLDPPAEPGEIAASCWAFPLVGAGVGALAAAAYVGAALLGCSNLVSGLLAVLAGIAVTGALHEDGLADTADGFGGGRDREERLQIMRDSRQGTFGVVALVFSIGLRAAALAAIGEPLLVVLAVIAAHAASRALVAATMGALRPARTDGLGASSGRPSLVRVVASLAIGGAVAVAALGPLPGAEALALSAVAVGATAALARRRIDGYTGDVLGAFQQIGEIVMLLVAAAR
jgi:adenosylcobinamide-GDP ribazoletransferase